MSVYSNLWSVPQSADVLQFYASQYENEVNLIPMFSVGCCPSYSLLKNCVSVHKIIFHCKFWSNRFFLKLVLLLGKIEPRLALSLK